MNIPIVWVVGGPGSGKTILTQNIVQKYGYKSIDVNAVIDQEIEKNTELGKRFAAKMNSGHMVPLADAFHLVENETLGNRDGIRGFIIDGYPQSISDASVLEDRIGAPDLILMLNVGQDTMDLRRSAQSPRANISATEYLTSVQPVLEHYASKTMQLDGDQDANNLFVEVVPIIDRLNTIYNFVSDENS